MSVKKVREKEGVKRIECRTTTSEKKKWVWKGPCHVVKHQVRVHCTNVSLFTPFNLWHMIIAQVVAAQQDETEKQKRKAIDGEKQMVI